MILSNGNLAQALKDNNLQDVLDAIDDDRKNGCDFYNCHIGGKPVLVYAMLNGCDNSIMKALFEDGATFSKKVNNDEIFSEIVFEKNDDLFNYIFENKDKLIEDKETFESFFVTCVIANNLKYVKKLIPFADNTYVDRSGYSAVHYACETDSDNVLKFLLENNFESQLLLKNKVEETPMNCAKFEKNTNSVQVIGDYLNRKEDLKKISKVINKDNVNHSSFKI